MSHSDNAEKSPHTRTLGLFLTDGFALMSYASIIEPFRAANSLARSTLYRWLHITHDGQAVSASNGASILADQAIADPLDCDMLFVFAAGDPAALTDKATFAWLRGLARRETHIVGVSGGPYLLARAGLLDGYRATIHWEHAAAIAEEFPNLAVESSLFVIDRQRLTCAGGTAGLDLAVELINRDHGAALAAQVSEWFIRTEPRRAESSQRLSLAERHDVTNDRVLRALAEMEAAIEEPCSRSALAARAGVSVRQLERLFEACLGTTVARMYMRIRLDAAAQLLRSTSLSVTAVGLACGFRSSSHFSRNYKARFGHSPSSAASAGQGAGPSLSKRR
jgi:transcriptional regulator GlxA family with amidase domain